MFVDRKLSTVDLMLLGLRQRQSDSGLRQRLPPAAKVGLPNFEERGWGGTRGRGGEGGWRVTFALLQDCTLLPLPSTSRAVSSDFWHPNTNLININRAFGKFVFPLSNLQ